MNDINSKMPILLIGNSFKYEVEATLKLFFHTARFAFAEDPAAADTSSGDFAVLSMSEDGRELSAEVRLGDKYDCRSCTLPEGAEKKM